MTDNRTTELLDGLRNVGNLHEFAELFGFDWHDESDWTWHDVAVKMADELEQAIAVTLRSEPPYDELLHCLENDWHISASWDGLRKFWCIELTEEGVRLRDATHGTLTADDVRDLIERHSAWVIGNNRCFHDGAYEEIADELNAKLWSGTCEFSQTTDNPPTCSNCGWQADAYDCDWLDGGEFEYDGRFCKQCGAKVRKAVGE